jgi:hypothetical protein
MRLMATTFVAAALAIGVASQDASAQVQLGGGPAASDCYVGLDTGSPTGALVEVTKKTKITCVDGSACDADGACNDSCTFPVGVCINIVGAPECTPPGTLDKVTAKGKVKGVKGDPGKIVIDTSQLLQGSACGAFVDVVIPTKQGKNDKPDKAGKANLKLSAKAPKGTKPRSDKDKFELVCEPAPSGCPASASGAFLD